MEESQIWQLKIPIGDVIEESAALMKSPEYSRRCEDFRKFDMLSLATNVESRFDTFFEIVFVCLKKGDNLTMTDYADADDAYDEFRKVRLLKQYIKSFSNMPNVTDVNVEPASMNFVFLITERQGQRTIQRLLTHDAREANPDDAKVYLPDEFVSVVDLQVNHDRFIVEISKKSMEVAKKLFTTALNQPAKVEPGTQDNRKKLFAGREAEIYKYYRAFLNATPKEGVAN